MKKLKARLKIILSEYGLKVEWLVLSMKDQGDLSQRSAAMMAAFSRTPGKHPCEVA